MDQQWKSTFLDKLKTVQSKCANRFDQAMADIVAPAFDDMAPFLRDNGFSVSAPLSEQGRRSFKFELAENAYVLVIFRFSGIGEFDVRNEIFVPGQEPHLQRSVGRVSDITEDWANRHFQSVLDTFVDQLSGNKSREKSASREEDLVAA